MLLLPRQSYLLLGDRAKDSRRPPKKSDHEVDTVNENCCDPGEKSEFDKVTAMTAIRSDLFPKGLENWPPVVINENARVIKNSLFYLSAKQTVFACEVIFKLACGFTVHDEVECRVCCDDSLLHRNHPIAIW